MFRNLFFFWSETFPKSPLTHLKLIQEDTSLIVTHFAPLLIGLDGFLICSFYGYQGRFLYKRWKIPSLLHERIWIMAHRIQWLKAVLVCALWKINACHYLQGKIVLWNSKTIYISIKILLHVKLRTKTQKIILKIYCNVQDKGLKFYQIQIQLPS